MILDSMLSHSPILLFAMSGLLLAAYGAVRFVQACLRMARRGFAEMSGRGGSTHHC